MAAKGKNKKKGQGKNKRGKGKRRIWPQKRRLCLCSLGEKTIKGSGDDRNAQYIPLILYLVYDAGREDPLGSNGREIKALSISVPCWKVTFSVCISLSVCLSPSPLPHFLHNIRQGGGSDFFSSHSDPT